MSGSASVSRTDWRADERVLCVSIHDVAPATWADCLRLVEAVRAVADIPLTWLVVPHYHFRPEQSPHMEACLNVALERGDELALHGYSHLDTEAGGGLRARFLRNVYTRREGEFAALAEAEARRRLELGLDWFAARGWTPTGFVPPAWLLGEGAWRALRDAPFAYTTTFSHFHCLPGALGRQADWSEGREVERDHGPPVRLPERGGGNRHRHDGRQAQPGIGGAQAWRGVDGASIQYGSGNGAGYGNDGGNGLVGGNGNSNGSVQNGPGNQSVAGGGSRQFDTSHWTSGIGLDGLDGRGGWDAVRGRLDAPARDDADRHGRRDRAGRHDQQGQHPPHDRHAPVEPNNRRGTHAILSPSLVYTARNRSGRFLSPRVADVTAAMLAHSPLVRFSLHPPDARYPELVRHIQRTLERLLEQREAVTKAEYARRLTSMDPTSRPARNPGPSHHQPVVHNAADRTSY